MGDNQFLAEIKYFAKRGPEWVEDYEVKYFYLRYSSSYYLGSAAHYLDFVSALCHCWQISRRELLSILSVCPSWYRNYRGATIRIFRYSSCYSVDNVKLGGSLDD